MGLPVTRRRRPGLRREEVALLAGVGASWYQWIEQGRAKNVSREVLEAIANVLQLDRVQHRYLMNLAGLSDMPPGPPEHNDYRLVQDAVHGYQQCPAYAVDRYWNILCANSAAARLLGPRFDGGNYLRLLFTDPAIQDRFVDWRLEAVHALSRFQAHAARYLDDPEVIDLTRDLRATSPDFATIWDSSDVADRSCAELNLRVTGSDHCRFHQVALDFAFTCGISLVLMTPVDDPMPALSASAAVTASR